MKKNKVTLIGINYYPEDTAIGLYSTQMVEYLEQNGFEVNVITGFPYYPQWEIRSQYKNSRRYLTEEINGIRVYRYKQYVPKNPNFIKRIIHLMDFTLGSLINVFKIRKTDIVISVVPFTTSILLGWLLKARTKSKLWVHVQDFEFDAALQTGVINSKKTGVKKIVVSLLYKLEEFLFSKADIASSISYSMLDKLSSKTDSEIVYLPNWIDPNTINNTDVVIHQYFSTNKFKVLYSGNIGDKQDWDTFLNFVGLLNQNEYEIVIVGDGSRKTWLKDKLTSFNNVTIHDPVPYEDLSRLLCSTDLHILFQKSEVIDTVMPSKLLGMMASAKPSLVTGNKDSEVKNIIIESKGGAFYSNNDVNCLINFAESLKLQKELGKRMGMNAREYIINNFSKSSILATLEEKIKDII